MDEKPWLYVVDPFHKDVYEALKKCDTINLALFPEAPKHDALRQATGILVRSDNDFKADDLKNASAKLKFIVKQGTGIDNVDLAAAKSRGIGVYNTAGVNAEAVAELALALALCVARRVTEFDRKLRDGEKLVRANMYARSLFRKSIGVVGMGAIGREMAVKWSMAMNGPIIAFDPHAPQDAWHSQIGKEKFTRVNSLEDLLKEVDVVTLHVPLLPGTANMISEHEFQCMKQDSILLNCARGGVVDEKALIGALNSGKLYGAGLDATVVEPPTRDYYSDLLLSHPRVVITPHVGANTEEMQSISGLRAVEIMLDLLHGRGEHKSLAL